MQYISCLLYLKNRSKISVLYIHAIGIMVDAGALVVWSGPGVMHMRRDIRPCIITWGVRNWLHVRLWRLASRDREPDKTPAAPSAVCSRRRSSSSASHTRNMRCVLLHRTFQNRALAYESHRSMSTCIITDSRRHGTTRRFQKFWVERERDALR